MISAYCCCLGDESEAAAEVPLAQVLPDKHEAADLFAAMDGHAPEVGFFVVPSLQPVTFLQSDQWYDAFRVSFSSSKG